MTDPLQERVKHLRLMAESAKRRSNIYAGISGFDDKKTAESYLKKGNYLWNSGMFMFQAEIFLNELSAKSIDILDTVKKSFENAVQDLDFIRLEAQAFASSQSNSVDYAVMEKSNK